jgi:hypothetical protein
MQCVGNTQQAKTVKAKYLSAASMLASNPKQMFRWQALFAVIASSDALISQRQRQNNMIELRAMPGPDMDALSLAAISNNQYCASANDGLCFPIRRH